MLPLPVSSSGIKITHNGVDYNLVESVFTDPAAASANLSVVSSNAGDTQEIVIYGIVAGVETSEIITLTGVAPVAGALDFTEVFEAYLEVACAGIITISDSIGNPLATIPIGRQMLSPDVFKRVGKDGNEVILPLNGGDEFVGEVLEGQWKKDYETGIVIFTARINGVATGMLEMGGESNAGGTLRWGWMNNHHPFVMMNEAELTVEMEIPTSDTGVAATEDIFFEFYIRDQKELITPTDDPNFIRVRFNIDENGLLMELHRRIAPAAAALLWDGSTADGNDGVDPAADKFWIFRFVFHDGVAGATAPEDVRHMHVYATHAAARAGLATATEEELIDTVGATQSPYNISNLLFNVGYPAYQIISAHTTWFGQAVGSGNEAISTYLRTSYPALFALKYDFADADYGDGDVELWDMKGSVTDADFQQVFDEDHSFGTYDIVLQNGLVRLLVDRVQQYGLEFYYWTGAAWVQPFDQLYFYAVTSAKDLSYPVVRSIESISPEETAIVIRLLDSATVNADYYIDMRITLERGKYSIKIDSLDVFPDQDVRFRFLNTTAVRFGSIGDDDIGDDDADVTGNNTTLTDNFLIAFDDGGTAILGAVYTDEKPAGGNVRFQASDGGYLVIEDIDAADTAGTIIWVTLIPFPLVAGLFIEAEDYTASTGARYFGEPAGGSTFIRARSAGADTSVLTIIGDTATGRQTDTITLNGVAWVNGSVDFTRVYILKLSPAAGNNVEVTDSLNNAIHIIPAGTTNEDNAMILAAATQYVRVTFTGITDIPKGRYIAAWRIREIAPINLNVKRWVAYLAGAPFLNEENTNVFKTVTANYLYYTSIFDITDTEAGETIQITAQKVVADASEVSVDYILIIPICDGEDWPQDLAHGALRTFTKPRRLYVR